MRTSESTKAIGEALSIALAGMENPTKSVEGVHKAKYAPLPEILNAVRPILGTSGLSLSLENITDGPTVGSRALMLHSSGEWIEYGPLMLPAGPDAQSAGSALTYSRRYLVCAILNIAADEDDDGAKAKRPEPEVNRGEGATGSGERGGGEDGAPDVDATVPPLSIPEPHEHVPGRKLQSGNALCIWEDSTGKVCGKLFKPQPTVFTAPVDESEVRSDLL